MAAIAARLVHLQVDRHEEYRRRADRQQQRVVEVKPPRGTIFDRRGRELAVSVEVDSAYAVPREVEDPEATARVLARIVGGDAQRLARLLGSRREFVWVGRKLDRPVAAEIRRLDLPGIDFLPESKRYYPMRELAAHVLGFVGTDDVGLGGAEAAYDDLVSGRAVRRTVLRDARRGTLLYPHLAFSEAEPGSDLHLTIDASIQHIVERELVRTIERYRARGGMVVVLDPRTGAVLAMASRPTFDPNRFNAVPPSRWRNRAISDSYEPGSTFKMVTAAAALEANVLDPSDTLDCERGGITLAGIRIRDHKPFDKLTLEEVIAKSSNVGAIKTGLLAGRERLYRQIVAFGFGRPTGIDLPGEAAGLLYPLRGWQYLTPAYVSFGQGVGVTPLQLTAAFAAVANGGTLVRPHVVRAVGRGADVEELPRSEARGRALSAATARSLERVLEAVITDGTGKRAAIPGYRVAGKTGTAQKAIPGRGYSAHIANFVGFAPARDPAVVCLVAIDEPTTAIGGGVVAAPAFAAIVAQVLVYLGVRPEREPIERWPGEDPEAGPPSPRRGTLLAASPVGPPGISAAEESLERPLTAPPVEVPGPTVPGASATAPGAGEPVAIAPAPVEVGAS
jgi:cell division protein FtsI (penicillin-binding protein 3)